MMRQFRGVTRRTAQRIKDNNPRRWECPRVVQLDDGTWAVMIVQTGYSGGRTLILCGARGSQKIVAAVPA